MMTATQESKEFRPVVGLKETGANVTLDATVPNNAGPLHGPGEISGCADQEIGAPISEAQMPAGVAPRKGHSSPDRCASDNIVELFDGAVGKPPDDWRTEEANKRLKILEKFDELTSPLVCGECDSCKGGNPDGCIDKGQGLSKAEAVKKIGVGYATFWRWKTRFDKDGFNGLLPKTESCGRHSWLRKLNLTPEELKFLMERCQGIHLDTDSVTTALRVFANSNECPPRLAEVILNPNRTSKHHIPESIREAAKVAKPVKDAHRGPRRLSLQGIYIPRKLDVIPGDVFTSDDTTPIWAWWVPWRECEEYPFGVKLMQGQFLPIMDIPSQDTPCGVLIGREKSSYRAADIWHLFGHCFEQVGLPRLGFQLERGSWEANVIRGQEVTYEVDEVSLSRRIGGLRQLPCNPHDKMPEGFIWPKTLQTFTSYLPKSKPIEAWFNRSQMLEGTLWGCLGRDQMRKPFEKTKKLFQECSRPRSKVDPRNYFLSHTEILDRVQKLLDYLRNEPMEGRVFKGIPRVNFEAAISEFPLWRLPEELRWMYRRDWTVLTITKGWARVRITHPVTGEQDSVFYCNPRVFAEIEGKQVAVYYDRQDCTQPAQIVAASRFTINGTIYEPGEHICEADYFDPPGMFLGASRTGFEIAKAWRSAVMSTYFTLVKHAPSRELPAEIAQRRVDSKGSTPATPTIVDGRPAAVQAPRSALAPATPEQLAKQSNRISRQAALAARLQTLSGDE